VLVWLYYSAQIVLVGAAFTRVHAEDHCYVATPQDNAVACPPARPQKPPAPEPHIARRAERLQQH